MGLTITTIVCAYNESRLLPGCLYSLRSQTRPPDEILVINNASTDETGAVARAVPGVRVIDEPAKGLVRGARDRPPRRADRHRRLHRRRLPRADHLARARRGAVLEAAPAGGGDRPVPLLRLGLERPRAVARLRPAGRAADARARAPRARRRRDPLRRQLRRPPRRARRDRRLRSADRVSRRRHQPGPPPDAARPRCAVPGLLGVDVGAPLPRDGQGRGLQRLRAEFLVGDPPPPSGRRDPSRREGVRAWIRTVSALRLPRPHQLERRPAVAARGRGSVRQDAALRRHRDHRSHPDEARPARARRRGCCRSGAASSP